MSREHSNRMDLVPSSPIIENPDQKNNVPEDRDTIFSSEGNQELLSKISDLKYKLRQMANGSAIKLLNMENRIKKLNMELETNARDTDSTVSKLKFVSDENFQLKQNLKEG